MDILIHACSFYLDLFTHASKKHDFFILIYLEYMRMQMLFKFSKQDLYILMGIN